MVSRRMQMHSGDKRMAMGTRRRRQRQEQIWISHDEVAKGPGHPFYKKVNELLEEAKFDDFAEKECAKFYAENNGRPSITPGTYFRMLLLGYFEGIDSERGMAWRAADSLSYRKFLGYDLSEQTPDHSTVSRTRRLYSVETHKAVMKWVLKILRKHGLADAQSVCIDATTLEANASMKSLVRRDTGQSYDDYLRQLAQSEGIEQPTQEQLARLDRKRKKKASNDDWTNPNDPSARITKMKDGPTKLAYKAEHAVDLASGALLAVTVQPAERGKRHWPGKAEEQRCVYANRQRVRGERSKRLQKLRGELCERSFAHCYETGSMRRMYVRGTDNVLKRVLVQAAG